MHQRVIADDGTEQPSKSRIYVDDALLAARNKAQMEMALAATLEAIFTVMGQPNTTLRQCPVAMDKWLDLVVAPQQTMLGLALNTHRLSVAILPAYRLMSCNCSTLHGATEDAHFIWDRLKPWLASLDALARENIGSIT